jgi:putative ABC transport system permease protein
VRLSRTWSLAIRALGKNRLQTALTMTGMTIGVATVLTMIALGSGAQTAIEDQVRSAGMNLILVTAGNYRVKMELNSADGVEGPAAAAATAPGLRAGRPHLALTVWTPRLPARLLLAEEQTGSGDPTVMSEGRGNGQLRLVPRQGDMAAGRGAAATLTIADADEIRRIKGVQYVSAGIHENAHASYGGRTEFTSLHGDDTTQPLIRRVWNFRYGRYFSKGEEKRAEPVAVLGQVASERLFGAASPVGKEVLVNGDSFRVVGVISSGSWMVQPRPGDDQFDAIYVPVTTMERLLKRQSLNTITVTTESTGEVTDVSRQITALLRRRHGIGPQDADDFTVNSEAKKMLAAGGMRPEVAHAVVGNVSSFEKVTLAQLGKTLDQASQTMTALLTSIAAVSLLVGGIGIMNVMLLSVSERTREIGIRRAIGARSADVLRQFLLEAATLSVIGGALGIAMGCAASGFISRMVSWSTRISAPAILVSFLVSAAI